MAGKQKFSNWKTIQEKKSLLIIYGAFEIILTPDTLTQIKLKIFLLWLQISMCRWLV